MPAPYGDAVRPGSRTTRVVLAGSLAAVLTGCAAGSGGTGEPPGSTTSITSTASTTSTGSASGSTVSSARSSGTSSLASGTGASTLAPSGAASASGSSVSGRSPPIGTTLRIATSGDILIHHPVQVDAARGAGFDFDPMFANLRAQISAADLAICHQETPIARTDADLTPANSMVFNAPPQIATALRRAGFDGCDNASNHVWDRALPGIQSTDAVLRETGLQHSGPTGAGPQGQHIAYYQAGPGGSVRVAGLAYTYTIFNQAAPNLNVPSDAPWLRAILWPAAGAKGIEADARTARAHGADLVVVSIHWGTEYQQAPTQDQLNLATALLRSGTVDLIVGAHAHVVQPCQKIDGRYVLYGMGNFLSNQAPSQAPGLTLSNQDGMLDITTFTRTASGWREGLTVQPTYVRIDGHVIERATTRNNPASLQRTTTALHALGSNACDPTIIRH